MDIKLSDFIAKYTGVFCGDTVQNNSQCVGLVEIWLDNFTLPHIFGNACDLLTNAVQFPNYTVVPNTPSNAPAPGDILVWDKTWGAGFGHTGVVVTADVNTVTVFEQNDPIDSPPRIGTHNYSGVSGWIHPNIFSGTTTQAVTDGQIQTQLNAQIKATSDCLTQLGSATQQNKTLQQSITQLETDKQTLQDELKALQSKYSEDENEIITLNGSISDITSSNKNYASQAQAAVALNKDLIDYQLSTADALAVTYDNTTKEADIQEAILGAIANKNAVIAGLQTQLKAIADKTAVPVSAVINKVIPTGFFSNAGKKVLNLFWETGSKQ